MELWHYTVQGQAETGKKYQQIVDNEHLAMAWAQAMLEVCPRLEILPPSCAPHQEKIVVEREAFYQIPLWDLTAKDLLCRLQRVLTVQAAPGTLDGFHDGQACHGNDLYFDVTQPVPKLDEGCYRIACYAVKGDSEGHYVHVELLTGPGTFKRLCLIKTFAGADAAWDMARKAHDFLAQETGYHVELA